MCHKIGCIVKQQGAICSVIKLTCRAWTCPDCAVGRRNRLVREAKEGKPQRFITLTVNPNWFDSPEERAAKLVTAWREVRRRFLKLRPSNRLEFMAVFELTKLGEPHLHIMQRGSFIPQKWLSQQMNELIGAPIVDIRWVKGRKQVAEYCAKYISKRPIKIGTLKRYWRSMKYLAVSRAELKRRRNEGARFFILENHWKAYLRYADDRYTIRVKRITASAFDFEWPPDRPPPLCVTEEGLGKTYPF